MPGRIKPIETVYNGYRFRSRLEARWAVFFDAAGIRYDYEPEGYDLGSAGRYLPDFWLPRQEAWVEVKSTSIGKQGILKASQLAIQSGHAVVLFCGTAFEPQGWTNDVMRGVDKTLFYPLEHDEHIYISFKDWVECPVCGEVFTDLRTEENEDLGHRCEKRNRCETEIRAAVLEALGRLDIKLPLDQAVEKIVNAEAFEPIENTPKILAAYQAARQARFEHGEGPQTRRS